MTSWRDLRGLARQVDAGGPGAGQGEGGARVKLPTYVCGTSNNPVKDGVTWWALVCLVGWSTFETVSYDLSSLVSLFYTLG